MVIGLSFATDHLKIHKNWMNTSNKFFNKRYSVLGKKITIWGMIGHIFQNGNYKG